MFTNIYYAFNPPNQRYVSRKTDINNALTMFKLSTDSHILVPSSNHIKKHEEFKINNKIIMDLADFLSSNLNSCYTASPSISNVPIAEYRKYPDSSFVFPLGNKDFGMLHIINRHVTGNYKSDKKNTTLLKYLNLEKIEHNNLDIENIAKRLSDIVILTMDLIKNNPVKRNGDLGVIEKQIKTLGMKNFKVVIQKPEKNEFNMIVGGKVLTVYDW